MVKNPTTGRSIDWSLGNPETIADSILDEDQTPHCSGAGLKTPAVMNSRSHLTRAIFALSLAACGSDVAGSALTDGGNDGPQEAGTGSDGQAQVEPDAARSLARWCRKRKKAPLDQEIDAVVGRLNIDCPEGVTITYRRDDGKPSRDDVACGGFVEAICDWTTTLFLTADAACDVCEVHLRTSHSYSDNPGPRLRFSYGGTTVIDDELTIPLQPGQRLEVTVSPLM